MIQESDNCASSASEHPAHKVVLVTGISGFLGGHIALQLMQKGYRVRGSLRRIGDADRIRAQFADHLNSKKPEVSFVEADLTSDSNWDAATQGCHYVIHAGSPFPTGVPKDEEELIETARGGTSRVLRSAYSARVERVVVTSSVAATNHGEGYAPFTEENWTNTESPRASAYYRSKTLAEQAAWRFTRESGLPLVVLNPSFLLGPLLSPHCSASVALIRELMSGKLRRVPKFGFSVADVRDVAAAHIRAMTAPRASGNRFIVGGRFFWLRELSAILAASFPDYASNLPRAEMPTGLVILMALFNDRAKMIVHERGRDLSVDTSKARRVLEWHARPEEETIAATAASLIRMGLIPPVSPSKTR